MADRLAEEVLRQCDQATCNLPIDIEGILTSYGLHIVWAGLTQEVPGLYIPGENLIICNRATEPGRNRFTLAHELYHHLEYLRDPSNKYIRFYTPGRNNERRANRFAGSLLARAGASLPAIQKRLGHKNLQTTVGTYLHSGGDEDAGLAALLQEVTGPGIQH